MSYLDAIRVKRRAKEHVQKEQLRGDVEEVEQLDEEINNEQIVATYAKPTSSSTTASFLFTAGTEAVQVPAITRPPANRLYAPYPAQISHRRQAIHEAQLPQR